jgi:ABC-type glycerol-3-phosphate transport system substrate-binding protein
MIQNGTVFYNDAGTAARFNQQIKVNNQNYNPGTSALDFYTQFARPSKRSYTWNSKSDNSIDAFVQGKVGMMIGYSYMIPTLKSKAPNLNWAVSAIPQVDNFSLKSNFANYWAEGVTKSSKNQAAAWEFLNFITQKDVLVKYYDKVKVPSSRRDILKLQSNDPELGIFADSAIVAKSVYKSDADKFEAIMLKMIDDVILRGVDIDKAVNDGVSQVNLIMRK